MRLSTNRTIAAIGIAASAVITIQGAVVSAGTDDTVVCHTWHPPVVLDLQPEHTWNPQRATGEPSERTWHPQPSTGEPSQDAWKPERVTTGELQPSWHPRSPVAEQPQRAWHPEGGHVDGCAQPTTTP